jgi:hypothetical protein
MGVTCTEHHLELDAVHGADELLRRDSSVLELVLTTRNARIGVRWVQFGAGY